MNVSKGDLAVTIKSLAGNEGRIVEVLAQLGEKPFHGGFFWLAEYGPCWLVRFSRPVRDTHGDVLTEGPYPDAWLRKVSGLPDVDVTETEQDKEIAL